MKLNVKTNVTIAVNGKQIYVKGGPGDYPDDVAKVLTAGGYAVAEMPKPAPPAPPSAPPAAGKGGK